MTDVKQEQEGTSSKRTDICRDYERGVCNRGNKCKFFHPDAIAPPDKNKLPVCRDFQNGICDRKSCKYMHITNEEERAYMSTGQLPSNLYNRMPVNIPPDGGAGEQVCKDFLNNLCDRGNRCKFRHITEDDWEHEKRYGMPPDGPRKRKRESFSNLDSRFLEDESDMLRRKIVDLQRQVADLRAMNDTLYDQNIRYRSQLRSSSAAPPDSARDEPVPVRYPRDDPVSVRYPLDDPVPVRYPRDDPVPVRYPRDDPVPVRYPRDDPVPVRYPRDDPVPVRYPRDDPVPVRYPHDDPLPVRYPRDDSLPARYPRDEPMPARYPRDEPMSARYPRDEPVSGRYPREEPVPGRYPRDEPVSGRYPRDEPVSVRYPDEFRSGNYPQPTGGASKPPSSGYPPSSYQNNSYNGGYSKFD